MNPDRAALAGVVGLVAVETVKAFRDYLPDISQVRKADTSDPGHASFVSDTRAGELAAVAVALVVAAAVSAVAGERLPLLVGAAVSVSMVALYELTLRRKERPST